MRAPIGLHGSYRHAATTSNSFFPSPFVPSSKGTKTTSSMPKGFAKRQPSIDAFHDTVTEAQQCLSLLHRNRESLMRDRIKAINQLDDIEKELGRQLQEDEIVRRMVAIPGVRPITASALSAEMGDGKPYRRGRDFAASLD